MGGGWQTFGGIATIALLGVVMAIPPKQQVINVEQLRFPTGVAAAETWCRGCLARHHRCAAGLQTHGGVARVVRLGEALVVLGWS